MKISKGINGIILLFSLFVLALVLLLGRGLILFFSADPFELRIPLEQKALFVPKVESGSATADLDPQFQKGNGVPSKSIKGSWPQFRGEQRDAISREKLDLTSENPKKIWEIPIGAGYAGPAVVDGTVYLIDYDEKNRRDLVRALSLDDGREIWRFSWKNDIPSDHGFSRTIPAVKKNYCVGIGPMGHAFCLDARSGEKKWLIDLVAQYGAKIPNWYAGQCVLLDEDHQGKVFAVLAPAGPDALLIAIDCESGKELWRTANPFQWKMTHSSVVKMDLDGLATYLYCGSGGVFGIRAEDGKILWGTSAWKIIQATCPSPLVLSDRKIFFCGGYGAGSMLLQLEKTDGGKYRTRILKKLKESEFGSTQQTPLWYHDHIWGVGRSAGKFCCIDSSGNVLWRNRTKTKFGDGPYIIADNKILAVNDNGLLICAEAVPNQWTPLFEKQVLDGHECWGPPALVDGRMILRSIDKMICIDLRKGKK
ncbi:MAG: PQQ-binding-like beta-propeller repeat protein [Planctomycetia bacterium]|nr:PQQ-binding-like beta-propeller repeat protein [Planctomycetia bacterium]